MASIAPTLTVPQVPPPPRRLLPPTLPAIRSLRRPLPRGIAIQITADDRYTLRRRTAYSLEQAAAVVGISGSHLSRCERGLRRLRPRVAMVLEDLYLHAEGERS